MALVIAYPAQGQPAEKCCRPAIGTATHRPSLLAGRWKEPTDQDQPKKIEESGHDYLSCSFSTVLITSFRNKRIRIWAHFFSRFFIQIQIPFRISLALFYGMNHSFASVPTPQCVSVTVYTHHNSPLRAWHHLWTLPKEICENSRAETTWSLQVDLSHHVTKEQPITEARKCKQLNLAVSAPIFNET